MSDSDKKEIAVEVNPDTACLEDLLQLAEQTDTGTVMILGEKENGSIQWGVVVVCCDDAGEMMQNLQQAVDSTIAAWKSRRMN